MRGPQIDRQTAYEILEVDADATKEDIMTAYRRLALEHHPDRGGDSAKFREATDAKNVAVSFIGVKMNEAPRPRKTPPRPGKPRPTVSKQEKVVKSIVSKLVENKITFDVTVLDKEETIISKDKFRIISVDAGGNVIVQCWKRSGDSMEFYKYENVNVMAIIREFLAA